MLKKQMYLFQGDNADEAADAGDVGVVQAQQGEDGVGLREKWQPVDLISEYVGATVKINTSRITLGSRSRLPNYLEKRTSEFNYPTITRTDSFTFS